MGWNDPQIRESSRLSWLCLYMKIINLLLLSPIQRSFLAKNFDILPVPNLRMAIFTASAANMCTNSEYFIEIGHFSLGLIIKHITIYYNSAQPKFVLTNSVVLTKVIPKAIGYSAIDFSERAHRPAV